MNRELTQREERIASAIRQLLMLWEQDPEAVRAAMDALPEETKRKLGRLRKKVIGDARGDAVTPADPVRTPAPPPLEDYAYRMGLHCARHGANATNCHFAIFATPENTRAWERGKRDGERGTS